MRHGRSRGGTSDLTTAVRSGPSPNRRSVLCRSEGISLDRFRTPLDVVDGDATSGSHDRERPD
jgi:hypothetical protein